jgi:threonine/homoserine/homoserine lactone efflux protein
VRRKIFHVDCFLVSSLKRQGGRRSIFTTKRRLTGVVGPTTRRRFSCSRRAVVFSNIWLFVLTAIMLLGSPGPAIAALVAIAKQRGFRGGLRFYFGLQGGLALGAAMSAAGLFSLLQAVPLALSFMTVIATAYLVWLAYKIATAPPRGAETKDADHVAGTARAGFMLGMTNPKAYLAFISLMASYVIIPAHRSGDVGLKWLLVVSVLLVVDVVWLWLGAILGKAQLSRRAERILNIVMGGTILFTAVRTFV